MRNSVLSIYLHGLIEGSTGAITSYVQLLIQFMLLKKRERNATSASSSMKIERKRRIKA